MSSRMFMSLADITPEDRGVVGAKAYHLSQSRIAGLPVPDGTVVTTQLFASMRVDLKAVPGAKKAKAPSLPKPFEDGVASLIKRMGTKTALVVRPSAAVDDLVSRHFLQAYGAVVGIRGAASLSKAILEVLKSCASEKVLLAATAAGIDPASLEIAILVQPCVELTVWGRASSLDPAGAGRGGFITVGSRIEPGKESEAPTAQTFRIDRNKARAVASLAASRGGRGAGAQLSLDQATSIAQTAMKLEGLHKDPVDFEWGFAPDGQLVLIQVCPRVSPPPPPVPELRRVVTSAPPSTDVRSPARKDPPVGGAPQVAPPVELKFADSAERSMAWSWFADLSPGPISLVQSDLMATVDKLVSPRTRVRTFSGFLFVGEPNPASRPAPTGDPHDATREWQEQTSAFQRRLATLAPLRPRDIDETELNSQIESRWTLCQDFLTTYFQRRAIGAPCVDEVRQTVHEVCKDTPPTDYTLLFHGDDSAAFQRDRKMYDLARAVTRVDGLPKIMVEGIGWDSLKPVETDPRARRWVVSLREYLELYGGDSHPLDLATPDLADDPTPLFRLLAALAGVTKFPPDEHRKRIRQVRRNLEREITSRLPSDRRLRFLKVLPIARTYTRLAEDDHLLWTRVSCLLRKALLSAGNRLARKGQLENDEDVYFVDINTLRRVLRSPTADLSMRDVASKARAVHESRMASTPPGRVVAGEVTVPPAAPGSLSGLGVAPGIATGRALVIRRPGDCRDFKPGDILVASAASASLTALLTRSAGLVADFSDPLSSAAVTAREYGLPCIVDTRGTTLTLKTGQNVQIDGTTGIITVLD